MPARNFLFKILLLATFVFIFLFTPKSVFAEWVKYPGNPILSGTPGWWDEDAVQGSSLIFEENTYKMWYVGNNGSGWRIGYTISPDGKSEWQKSSTSIIEVGSPEWDEIDTADPFVIHEGNLYKMWYSSDSSRWYMAGADKFRIRYATSSAELNWIRSNQWILKGTLGSWDSGGIARGLSVIKIGNDYQMWYAGVNEAPMGTVDEKWQIGYATSPDGINWIKYPSNENPQPVIEPIKSWELNSVSYPHVLYEDGIYHMWYAATSLNLPIQIVYAYSTNGIDWVKPANKNPVFTIGSPGSWDSTYIASPFVIKQGNTYKMWYSGYNSSLNKWQIGYAEYQLPSPQPIVLLPGLGASWNREKILFGNEVPQSAWKIPPWVPHYNNLIETLESAGYQKDENLFVFAYDWTKPVDLIADDLKNYINTVVDPPEGIEINLIGHSLGGLVGRAYIQENSSNHGVDDLITLGSPHKGAPQVYKAWEGADLHDLMAQPWRLAAELLLTSRGRDYHNKVEALRNLAPVLRDLLPIFDYLKWHSNNEIISETSLPENSRNLWLANIGVPPYLLGLLSAVVGTIGETPRWLRLVLRDRTDEILGRWQLGKPIGQENETGDKTVLAESAQLEGANIYSLPLDHGELVANQQGIETVLEILGLESETTGLPAILSASETQTLVFALTSLDNLRVINPDGQVILPEEDNIIVIPEAPDGSYQVEVIGNQLGSYRLVVGQLTDEDDIWSEYEDTITLGETDIYSLPIDSTFKTTDSYLIKLINEKLEKLLKEIDGYNINRSTKMRIRAYLLKIRGELKPVSILLERERNSQADRFVQKAILTNFNLAQFVEEKIPNSPLLPQLHELQGLLSQLHDLL